MRKAVNLAPIEEYLTDAIDPENLSKAFDELAYIYADAIIELVMTKRGTILNKNTAQHLFMIVSLRDVFRRCAVK